MIDIYVVRKQVMRRGDYETRRREGIVILCIACNITLGKFTHRYTTAHAMTKTRQ